MIRAIRVPIYMSKRNCGDCSNNGISARYDSVLIACDDGFIEIDEDDIPENLCKIVNEPFGGHDNVFVEPWKSKDEGNIGWMMGGSLVYSCDARFGGVPLRLHDRQETPEMYELLSR